MKVFVCSRRIDSEQSIDTVDGLLTISGDSIVALKEDELSDDWKERIESQFKEVDFVLFIIGKDTFGSDPMKWEYLKAKSLNKRIVGIRLRDACEESLLYCKEFQVFRKIDDCWRYLDKTYQEDRQLLLEQYKIMVGSTEKVTDQRMRVNNLFFTVTSSILSISLVVGKAFEFSFVGSLGMLILSFMGFIVTFFWEKLVRSYGKLNTGKFTVIDQIEKQLRTNMFEHEWSILQKQIGYESNTDTEASVITRFRWFIFCVVLVEVIYILSQINLDKISSLFEWIKCV